MSIARLHALYRLPRALNSAVRPLTTIAHASPSTVSESEPVASPHPDPRPHHMVVSVSGADRTGIVKTFTSVAEEYSANIEESRMAILGGDFAMIVYLTLPDVTESSVLLKAIQNQLPEFSVTVRETIPPEEKEHADTRTVWKMSLEGPDQPGIVSAITQALATHGCNVHEMSTETMTAPFAGYEMFKMDGTLSMMDDQLDGINTALTNVEERFGANIILNQVVPE